MSDGGGADNRRSERVPIALEIEYRSAGAFLVAYSTNLSKGGIFIETSDPLPVGATLTLRLHAPNTKPCELQGSVAWTRSEATGSGTRLRSIVSPSWVSSSTRAPSGVTGFHARRDGPLA